MHIKISGGHKVLLTIGLGLLTLTSVARTENWAQWRGPNFNGSSPEQNLPEKFSKTEGVAWATDMPGLSAATPIIWQDHVFTTAAIEDSQKLVALALDRKTGKVLWQQEVADGYGRDRQSTFATASPLTDGNLVWFFFGNGHLAAFDFSGKKVWARDIQKDYGTFAFLWTFSSTPMLFNGILYLQVLQRDIPVNGRGQTDGPNESYLLAMDPQTGKELWRNVRPTDALMESREAFSTPIPYKHGNRTELMIMGGDYLTGHNPDNGKELWRWGTWNTGQKRSESYRVVPSPVAGGGVALACGPKDTPVYAVKLGGNGKLDDSALAWKSEDRELTSDVATPLFYLNKFYVVNTKKRILLCVEPATGKILWRGPLAGTGVYDASPTGADGKIYCIGHNGDVNVAKADGNDFQMLATTQLGGEKADFKIRSSIAISQGSLFIRTGAKLFCIGKK